MYPQEKRDLSRIIKLNKLKDAVTFWDDVRKLTKHVESDHAIKSWQRLAEQRYNQLTYEERRTQEA